jgi:hypothetical protein
LDFTQPGLSLPPFIRQLGCHLDRLSQAHSQAIQLHLCHLRGREEFVAGFLQVLARFDRRDYHQQTYKKEA